jgi:hypothetical protein
MYLGIPQIIYLSLVGFGLTMSIVNHGKPRSNENAMTTFIGGAVSLTLLYFGGFFK